MAQYFTDFAGESVGSSPPTGWSERWTASGQYEVATGPVAYWAQPFVDQTDFLSWDTVGSISGDCEVLVLFQSSDSGGAPTVQGGCVIHGQTASTSGYHAALSGGSDIVITRLDSGTPTTLATVSFSWSANTNYWIRMQRSGNNLRTRVWADGGSEPGTWIDDRIDATYTSGYAGLFARRGNGNKQWSKVGIGTGGDSAPSSAVGGSVAGSGFLFII